MEGSTCFHGLVKGKDCQMTFYYLPALLLNLSTYLHPVLGAVSDVELRVVLLFFWGGGGGVGFVLCGAGTEVGGWACGVGGVGVVGGAIERPTRTGTHTLPPPCI